MKRHAWLLLITLAPPITMLGSLVLMNDNNPASRRGMVSVPLFYAACAFLLIFAFIIGYVPKTNQAALRLGSLCFFLYAIFYLLRMRERLGELTSGQADENAGQMIFYSLIGLGAALVLYVAGYLIPYKRRKKHWEDAR